MNKGDNVIKFFQERITHVKGQAGGQYIVLEDWQKKIIKDIFGTLREDGTRQYRYVYIEIPRKNAKTTLLAGIALYLLLYDREPGAEIYSAAGDREQAGLMHNIAKGMVQQDKLLNKQCKITLNSIVKKGTTSFYKAISADAATKHGYNAHAVLFDELHTQPDRELWDVLTTSVGSRRQPLIIAITTAGFDKNSICWEVHEYARKVKEGIIKDDAFYPVLFAAGEDDDIYTEETWKKANPGYGTIVSKDYIESAVNKIKNTPSFESTFRRLHLNQWVGSEITWISDKDWMSCDLGRIEKGDVAYGGLDLASVRDITAFVLVFPIKGVLHVKPFFFINEEALNDNDKYREWNRKGYMIVTPGNVTDYNFIKKTIIQACEDYDIKSIAYDRWNSSQLVIDLTEEGIPMNPIGQGYASMSAPTKELEKRVLGKEINHEGNPVLRWMCSNVLLKEDPAGNIKIDKGTSKAKVDGMVALVMAIAELMNEEKEEEFVYNKRGIITI